jgi:hypothetical protein
LLALEPDDAIVSAIYTDEKGAFKGFKGRTIYKSSTSADDTEHYLYLSDEVY